ncbi:MAG: hypothetical protein OEN20_07510, partial [Gammaproteobacteria bacterium]|nr:hypothetical protein [Gammaproteobacteria bacterium]
NLFAPQALFATALVLAGARVATGYCAIARLLALLPINRQAPLTWAVVKCTLFAKPIPGSVLQQAMNPGDMARA